MTQHTDDAVVAKCPKCMTALPAVQGPVSREEVGCSRCRWRGTVETFLPLPLIVERAEVALPDDATCAHHPEKRAVATCEGTGDYICSLCSVELEGKTFSAQYMATAGKTVASEQFNQYLKRPDSEVFMYFLLCFVPLLGSIWSMGAPIWVPLAIVRIVQAFKLRSTNRLYRKAVTTGRLVVAILLMLFVSGLLVLWLLFFLGAFIGAFADGSGF